MKKIFSFYLFLVFYFGSWAQNTIGLPQVINFNNNIFQGGTQTWDIRQDADGRMYFANNEGLLTYDGSYWNIYPQPNKTILRSIALDKNRIYAGGQDELGYYAPDSYGILQYTSLKNLIPRQYSTFTDVWEIEVFGQSVFFRTWDRIFEYKDDAIRAYPAQSGWQIMKKTGNKLIAQDKKRGLFQFINNEWISLNEGDAAPKFEITGLVALDNDSLLVSSLQNGLYIYHNGVLRKKATGADNSFIKNHIYGFEQINHTEFVAGTTSEGCLVINAEGQVVQKIARPKACRIITCFLYSWIRIIIYGLGLIMGSVLLLTTRLLNTLSQGNQMNCLAILPASIMMNCISPHLMAHTSPPYHRAQKTLAFQRGILLN